MPRKRRLYSVPNSIVFTLLKIVSTYFWRRVHGWLLSFRWIYFWQMNRWIPEASLERHAYIIGGTGSGKSELLKVLAYRLIQDPNKALVFIDPHGDAAYQLARFKEFQKGNRLIYIDPYKADVRGCYPCFNTFAIPTRSPRAVTAATQQHIEVFREILRDEFTLSMEGVLVPCLYTLLETGGMALDDLQHFMNDDLNSRYIRLGQKSNDETVRHYFHHDFSKANKQTKEAIARRLQVLLNHRFFRHFLVGTGLHKGQSSFDLKEAVRKRKVIIFRLNSDELGPDVAYAIGRFIVARLNLIALSRARSPKKFRTPTYVLIDECHNFITRSVEQILTGGRKYGMHLILAQQQYGQGMSSSFIDALSNNTWVKICGSASRKTRKTFHDETGAHPVLLEKLGVGSFVLHVQRLAKNKPPTFMLGYRGFLGFQNSMDLPHWKELLKRQFHFHYHPLSKTKDTAQKDFPYPLD